MIPMNEVIANDIGIVSSWGQTAAEGRDANLVKSGALTMSVEKLLIALIIPVMTPQVKSDPVAVAGCFTTGPMPPARTRAHMSSAMPPNRRDNGFYGEEVAKSMNGEPDKGE